MTGVIKRAAPALLLSVLSAVVIIADSSNRWNELLYSLFYTGLLMTAVDRIAGKELRPANRLFIAAILFFSLLLRIYLFPFETADYTRNFALWYDAIAAGGFRSMKEPFYDYAPPYMYIMYLCTKLHVSKLVAIKSATLFFEYFSAFWIYRIVRIYRPEGTSAAAALLFLFIPTVVMNGSFWGQCDVIFTSFLLGCLYFLLRERSWQAMFCFALAFAFKLQAVFFILPLALAFFHKKISWTHFLLVPLVYVICILPLAIIGRPFSELLLIYFVQADAYSILTANAATVYTLIPWAPPELFTKAGVIFTAAIITAFAALFFFKRKEENNYGDMLLYTAALSLIVIPYFLPKMHERYFFPADVFALLLAFRWPKLFYVPALCILISLFSYYMFLFGFRIYEYKDLGLVFLAMITFLLRDFFIRFYSGSTHPSSGHHSSDSYRAGSGQG